MTAARVVSTAIRFYQAAFSPALGPSCRYAPSCSAYAVEAVDRFGAVRGSWLGLRRILRCHPWHDGGYDPVPAIDGHASRCDSVETRAGVELSSVRPAVAGVARMARTRNAVPVGRPS